MCLVRQWKLTLFYFILTVKFVFAFCLFKDNDIWHFFHIHKTLTPLNWQAWKCICITEMQILWYWRNICNWLPRKLSFWLLLVQKKIIKMAIFPFQWRKTTQFVSSVLCCLTHWGGDKMAAIFQMTFSNAFSQMKMYEFQFNFHWNLFLRVQLRVNQHWFTGNGLLPVWRQAITWNNAVPVHWRIYAAPGGDELTHWAVTKIAHKAHLGLKKTAMITVTS